jgi:hypothetical protein
MDFKAVEKLSSDSDMELLSKVATMDCLRSIERSASPVLVAMIVDGPLAVIRHRGSLSERRTRICGSAGAEAAGWDADFVWGGGSCSGLPSQAITLISTHGNR